MNKNKLYSQFSVLDENLKLCDPWETKNFSQHLEFVPDGHCDHCLPDCISTIYDIRVSSAPFKACDHTNIGSSSMCQFSTKNDQINPPIWAADVNQEYQTEQKTLPEFLNMSGIFPSTRQVVPTSKVNQLVLKSKALKAPTYNAFENDIAIVNFYFDKSTALQFIRQKRMTIVDYISQMGGLLGLFIGFSFISGIELIYWFTIRLGRNISSSKGTLKPPKTSE